MPLKVLKPTTPTRRHTVLLDNSALDKKRPEKTLTKSVKYKAGRNFRGKQTARHRGGRAKRLYREIDFIRDKHDVPGVVESIEYDPNRSVNIALVKYADGERRYILAPSSIKVGSKIEAGEKAPIRVGNALPMKKIPAATFVHNVELKRGNGGTFGRSAGTSIQIQGGAKGYIQLKLPSGEIRLVREENYATIGTLGNTDHKNVKFGKAGRKRKMGIRPTVRGVAQSGANHPHADGQGKGGRHGTGGPAKDPWGNRVGTRTRKNKRTNKFIVKRRSVGKGRKFKKYKTIV
ncbi:MAG: 50S ribosomal protein L2 [Candidatus Dojkabacteria bacterium]